MNYRDPKEYFSNDYCINEIPQFVSIGFDDNAISGYSDNKSGMKWAIELFNGKNNPKGCGNALTYDNEHCTATYFCSSKYIDKFNYEDPADIKKSWLEAYEKRNEIGNHCFSHQQGGKFQESEWDEEIKTCNSMLGKLLKNESGFEVKGFRAPFLEINKNLFNVLLKNDFVYDSSIEEGWQPEQDGKNFYWPYTLHSGSPGYDILRSWDNTGKESIGFCPGLWEIPIHVVIAPPDEKCEQYNIPVGFRDRLKESISWFDVDSGKITGFDYNLWCFFKMSKEEFVATMKYTLDLRIEGNHCPFTFGAHSEVYSKEYLQEIDTPYDERIEAIEEFLEYALSKDCVRVVSYEKILKWINNPVGLNNLSSSIKKKDIKEDIKIPIILKDNKSVVEGNKKVFKLSEDINRIDEYKKRNIKWYVNDKLVDQGNKSFKYEFKKSAFYNVKVELKNSNQSYYDESKFWVYNKSYFDDKKYVVVDKSNTKINLKDIKNSDFKIQQKDIAVDKLNYKCNVKLFISEQEFKYKLSGKLIFNEHVFLFDDWMCEVQINNINVSEDLNFALELDEKSDMEFFWQFNNEIVNELSNSHEIDEWGNIHLKKMGNQIKFNFESEARFKLSNYYIPKDWKPKYVIFGITSKDEKVLDGVAKSEFSNIALSDWYKEARFKIDNYLEEFDLKILANGKRDYSISWWCE